jgi:hypothetical protein
VHDHDARVPAGRGRRDEEAVDPGEGDGARLAAPGGAAAGERGGGEQDGRQPMK